MTDDTPTPEPDDTAPTVSEDTLRDVADFMAEQLGVLQAHAMDALRSLLQVYATTDPTRGFHHEHRTLPEPQLVRAGDWPLADLVVAKSMQLPVLPDIGPLAGTLVTFSQLHGDEPATELSAQMFVATPAKMREAGRLLNDAMNQAASLAQGGNRHDRRRR